MNIIAENFTDFKHFFGNYFLCSKKPIEKLKKLSLLNTNYLFPAESIPYIKELEYSLERLLNT